MSVKKTKKATLAGKKKSKKISQKTSRKKSTKPKAPKTKKSKTKKTDPDIQKNIKKAVENIPKLILEERERVREQKQAENKTTSSNKSSNNIKTNYTSPAYKKKNILMWLGVILLTLFIFIMWFLNTRSTLYDISKNESKETKIWNNSKQNLQKILEDVDLENLTSQDADKSEDTLIEISTDKLNLLIKAISNITSTTETIFVSSTDSTSTSTTTSTSTQN